MEHKSIFSKLWREYSNLNPSVNRIHSLLEAEGENIINDHVAFRTYDIPGINMDSLSQVFLKSGYVPKGDYFFKKKRLRAKHYEHETDELAPKVFISELITSDFSEVVHNTAKMVAEKAKSEINDPDRLIFAGAPWDNSDYETYKKLLSESEYAAWMYIWGFRANHFTIFINHLKNISTIEDLNDLLKSKGFFLNNSGGEIKGTAKQRLKQSSTLADKVEVKFRQGNYHLPCCYYEFAQRYETESGSLYSGFISNSADKIFESTDSR